MCWIYERVPQGGGSYIYTVGFYTIENDAGAPRSKFHPARDYETREQAEAHINYLNGGPVEI